MKYTLFIFFVLLTSQSFTQNFTDWMNPKPFSSTPHSVCFIDEKTGWIAGLNSEITKTTDSGMSWNSQSAPNGDYQKVYFISSDEGWLIGKKNNRKGGLVAYTNNGGRTWVDIWEDSDESNSFVDIDTDYGNAVYICGDQGVVKTTNIGKTWENLIGVPQNTVQFLDDKIGFVGNSDGEILKTINGGISWHTVTNIVPGCINKIRFTDDNTGYAVGYKYLFGYARYTRGFILKTVDAGDTWTVEDSSDSHNSNFIDLVFQNEKPFEILAIDLNGKNCYYLPTNKHWTEINNYSGEPIHYNGAYCLKGRFYLVGEIRANRDRKVYIVPIFLNGDKAYQSDNYGYNNNKFSVATKSTLNQVDFINDDMGWVVGDDGTILKTINAGKNWENIYLFAFDLKYVSCQSTNSVYAANMNKLIHSNDGGKSWNLIQSPNLTGISGIKFFDEKNGFVFRLWQHAIRTYDGGLNWTELPLYLTSILFFNSKTWWGIYNEEGDDFNTAILYKTNDGGKTWSDTTDFGDSYIKGISFIDENNGWLVESRALSRTYDGGKTWNMIYQPGKDEGLISFYAISKNVGFMLKKSDRYSNPYIFLVTYDGGFSFQSIKEYSFVNELFYGSKNYGWGIGERGSIMRINHNSFQTNK